MVEVKEFFQADEWKIENHAPIIEAPVSVKKGEIVRVRAAVGEDIAHPHQKEHHIGWIALFFRPEGETFPYRLGRANFSVTEEADQDASSGYITHHEVCLSFKPEKGGTIFATSLCNRHGSWQSSKDLKVS